MTEKRFKLIDGIKKGTHSGIWDNQKQHNMGIGDELWLGEVVGMLNEGVILAEETTNLKEENEQLKSELKIYRKIANCGNCHYHNYDWFDDGDDFEVCNKKNDMEDGICEDWREL